MEESRSKRLEPKISTPQHQIEAFENVHKEIKKKDRRFGRDWQLEGSTPATGVHVAKPGEQGQKKKNKNRCRSDKMTDDVSQVMYWNCNQKEYYSNTYPKPSKN